MLIQSWCILSVKGLTRPSHQKKLLSFAAWEFAAQLGSRMKRRGGNNKVFSRYRCASLCPPKDVWLKCLTGDACLLAAASTCTRAAVTDRDEYTLGYALYRTYHAAISQSWLSLRSAFRDNMASMQRLKTMFATMVGNHQTQEAGNEWRNCRMVGRAAFRTRPRADHNKSGLLFPTSSSDAGFRRSRTDVKHDGHD